MGALYDGGREGFLAGLIDWDADTIKVVLIDTADYTFSAAHDFLDDVPGGARVGTPQTLGSKTTTAGVADAADAVFTAVTGDSCEAVIIWKDTGSEATSRLICYADGFTVTPNTGDITIQWSNGSSRIFAL